MTTIDIFKLQKEVSERSEAEDKAANESVMLSSPPAPKLDINELIKEVSKPRLNIGASDPVEQIESKIESKIEPKVESNKSLEKRVEDASGRVAQSNVEIQRLQKEVEELTGLPFEEFEKESEHVREIVESIDTEKIQELSKQIDLRRGAEEGSLRTQLSLATTATNEDLNKLAALQNKRRELIRSNASQENISSISEEINTLVSSFKPKESVTQAEFDQFQDLQSARDRQIEFVEQEHEVIREIQQPLIDIQPTLEQLQPGQQILSSARVQAVLKRADEANQLVDALDEEISAFNESLNILTDIPDVQDLRVDTTRPLSIQEREIERAKQGLGVTDLAGEGLGPAGERIEAVTEPDLTFDDIRRRRIAESIRKAREQFSGETDIAGEAVRIEAPPPLKAEITKNFTPSEHFSFNAPVSELIKQQKTFSTRELQQIFPNLIITNNQIRQTDVDALAERGIIVPQENIFRPGNRDLSPSLQTKGDIRDLLTAPLEVVEAADKFILNKLDIDPESIEDVTASTLAGFIAAGAEALKGQSRTRTFSEEVSRLAGIKFKSAVEDFNNKVETAKPLINRAINILEDPLTSEQEKVKAATTIKDINDILQGEASRLNSMQPGLGTAIIRGIAPSGPLETATLGFFIAPVQTLKLPSTVTKIISAPRSQIGTIIRTSTERIATVPKIIGETIIRPSGLTQAERNMIRMGLRDPRFLIPEGVRTFTEGSLALSSDITIPTTITGSPARILSFRTGELLTPETITTFSDFQRALLIARSAPTAENISRLTALASSLESQLNRQAAASGISVDELTKKFTTEAASTPVAPPETEPDIEPEIIPEDPEPIDPNEAPLEPLPEPQKPIREPDRFPQRFTESDLIQLPAIEPVIKPVVFPQPLSSIEPIRPLKTIIEPTNITIPIIAPKLEPITQPISIPTTQPSLQPSTQPTTQPITQPITQPVTQPITEPISVLDLEPIIEPSIEPIIQPSIITQPSLATQPSIQPNIQPNIQPSIQPSAHPSIRPQIIRSPKTPRIPRFLDFEDEEEKEEEFKKSSVTKPTTIKLIRNVDPRNLIVDWQLVSLNINDGSLNKIVDSWGPFSIAEILNSSILSNKGKKRLRNLFGTEGRAVSKGIDLILSLLALGMINVTETNMILPFNVNLNQSDLKVQI